MPQGVNSCKNAWRDKARLNFMFEQRNLWPLVFHVSHRWLLLAHSFLSNMCALVNSNKSPNCPWDINELLSLDPVTLLFCAGSIFCVAAVKFLHYRGLNIPRCTGLFILHWWASDWGVSVLSWTNFCSGVAKFKIHQGISSVSWILRSHMERQCSEVSPRF